MFFVLNVSFHVITRRCKSYTLDTALGLSGDHIGMDNGRVAQYFEFNFNFDVTFIVIYFLCIVRFFVRKDRVFVPATCQWLFIPH